MHIIIYMYTHTQTCSHKFGVCEKHYSWSVHNNSRRNFIVIITNMLNQAARNKKMTTVG